MATGCVTSVIEDAPAFRMTVFQSPYPYAPLSPLQLQAIFPFRPVRSHLPRRIPPVDSFLTFSGIVQAVEGVGLNIAIDEVAYLPRMTTTFICGPPFSYEERERDLAESKSAFDDID